MSAAGSSLIIIISSSSSSLSSVLKDDQGSEYLQASKEVARLFHERGDMEEAKEAIEGAMRKHEACVQSQGT